MKKVLDFITSTKIEFALAVVGTLSMILIMFMNVVTRYMLNFTFSWSDEAIRYFNLIAAFAAISACFKSDTHIKIDVFVENIIPHKARKYFRLISYVFTLIFCMMIGYYGFILVSSQYKMGQVSTALGIPMFALYAIIPIGMVFSSIQILFKIFKDKAYLNDPAQ